MIARVESVAMKRLPDILTSATFWASIGTLWATSGAWFTYVAAAVASRQQTYEGILSLIKGLEAELALISQWASGEEPPLLLTRLLPAARWLALDLGATDPPGM